MQVSAILLAAGKGKRFKSGIPKLLAKINHRPVLVYSLETLNRHPRINEIIVATNRLNREKISALIRKHYFYKARKIILGAKVRRDSVANGLKAISAGADLVLIHDAARPFLQRRMISALIAKAQAVGAAIAGVPVKCTVKRVKGKGSRVKENLQVKETIDRSNLWEIQTPQVFRKDLILKAYRKFAKTSATDDAMLVEKLGHPVAVVRGSYKNIKITNHRINIYYYISITR
jgi:2-C-methyl-D-erythritol 4-phosphate cytidylyltransferase